MTPIQSYSFAWMNEPDHWSLSDGQNLIFNTHPKTDFWRKTHYGFVRDSGHFWFTKLKGEFELVVKIIGKYRDQYDQAGIMIRLDEQNWVKAGIEYVDGVQKASAVVTRDHSDWSVVPLASNPDFLWLKVKKENDAIEISYSLEGSLFELLRLAFLPPGDELMVGLMAASPDGGGFEVGFEELQILVNM